MESSWGEKATPRRLALRRYRGPERRHSHRHRLTCLRVTYRRPLLWLLKMPPSEACRVSNITSHGLKFYTLKKLKVCSAVDMTFDAPDGVYRVASDNHVKAKIMWRQWSRHRHAWRTGAHFVHVSKRTHDDLVSMMKEAALHCSQF